MSSDERKESIALTTWRSNRGWFEELKTEWEMRKLSFLYVDPYFQEAQRFKGVEKWHSNLRYKLGQEKHFLWEILQVG